MITTAHAKKFESNVSHIMTRGCPATDVFTFPLGDMEADHAFIFQEMVEKEDACRSLVDPSSPLANNIRLKYRSKLAELIDDPIAQVAAVDLKIDVCDVQKPKYLVVCNVKIKVLSTKSELWLDHLRLEEKWNQRKKEMSA